jgi:hypothetical protein
MTEGVDGRSGGHGRTAALAQMGLDDAQQERYRGGDRRRLGLGVPVQRFRCRWGPLTQRQRLGELIDQRDADPGGLIAHGALDHRDHAEHQLRRDEQPKQQRERESGEERPPSSRPVLCYTPRMRHRLDPNPDCVVAILFGAETNHALLIQVFAARARRCHTGC